MKETNLNPIWKCPIGAIKGWNDEKKGVLRATGIKYATAPRFEAPTAEPANTDKIVEATKWSPASPQPKDELTDYLINQESREMKVDEHCQYLSVTTPKDTSFSDNLPVMVWIHGGSYVTGAGDYPIYDPAVLVREQRVIVVTVTYRLGLLGYLGSKESTPANLGLLDQIEALKWVKQNIAGFGGNPENITVFGESAGGDAAAHLMIAKGTEGLFNRAIIQSAPFGLLPAPKEMKAVMLEEKKKISADDSLEKVAEVQADIQEKVKPFGLKSSMPFGVQYGEFPLPNEDDLEHEWNKAARRIEILVGNNKRELAPFIPYIPVLNKLTKTPFIGKYLAKASIKFLTKKIYKSGVEEFTRRHHLGGGSGYKYEISGGAPRNQLAGGHASEIPYLFENEELWEGSPILDGITWEKFHRQGQVLRQIWGVFAKTGQIKPVHVDGLIKVKKISS
ncbi:carboxylesterase family protein [Marinilactibacillus psychrotolerans]|uniref:carboxylesterase family protein n=1 Tax=Marinilactibacillus psychrotolerans TaxID=191770 RepID=UPI003819B061